MPPFAQHQTSTVPVVVLLGGPGSGKGTHGQALATALGYEHLSSGEHFRDHIRRATPLGRRASEFIENGHLVSAELVIDSSDFLSSSAMCSATFGVVSQQPSHDRCFQALNASRPKIGRKHDLGGDNLAEGCGLLGYFHFQWRRHLVGNDSQLAQDRQALLDGGMDDVSHGIVLFRHDVRAQRLNPGVGVALALAAEQAGRDELQ